MDHAAAQYLDPPGAFAYRASFAAAKSARDVELCARLGEWKIAGAKQRLGIMAQELAHELAQHPFEMSHRDNAGAIHHEAFDLGEHRGSPHTQFIAAVTNSRADHRERRPALLHHPDL